MPRTWRPPSPDQECAKRVRGFVYAALGPAQVAIRAHGTLGADYARRLRSVARELPRGSTEPPVTQAIGNDRSWPTADRQLWAIEMSKRTFTPALSRDSSIDRRSRRYLRGRPLGPPL
jgi:hypothetical protein